jgi:hypothetical protein
MRRSITALVVLLGMAGTGVAAAPGASAATTCRVVDTTSNQSYASLQDAVTAAAPGDTLFVKGTCTGTTEIGKNLTVTGQSQSGTKTATLNGGAQGAVLTIDSGAAVTLNTLVITNGSNFFGGGIFADGGTVTLNRSTVTGNSATQDGGGGIANATFIPPGGFAFGGTVTLNDSTVTANNSGGSDGGGFFNLGTLILNGSSSISNNTNPNGGSGGGVWNESGTVTLNGSSTITGNTAGDGAGIYNLAATVTLNDSSTITGNTAADEGGGIFEDCDSTLNGAVAGTGGNVYNNHPDDIFTNPFC